MLFRWFLGLIRGKLVKKVNGMLQAVARPRPNPRSHTHSHEKLHVAARGLHLIIHLLGRLWIVEGAAAGISLGCVGWARYWGIVFGRLN
jgi:hypothetical protein